MEKQALRNEMKTLLVGMTDEERNSQSRELCEIILSLPEFRGADAVFLYYPLKTEPDVKAVFNEAIRLGKRVAFPVCSEDVLEFYYVNGFEELMPGSFGTTEPDVSICEKAKDFPEEKRIIVVPGLAFDKKGRRLGRGRGYYDKYLTDRKFTLAVGSCFKNQILESIPYEAHDAEVTLLWS